MNRRNDCLIHLNNQSPGLLGVTPNRRLDQDVTSSYIHIKNYNYEYCMRPPPPLLFKLLIYNTLTRKGFDPPTQSLKTSLPIGSSKFWFKHWKMTICLGFYFRGWVGTRVLFLFHHFLCAFTQYITQIWSSSLLYKSALAKNPCILLIFMQLKSFLESL